MNSIKFTVELECDGVISFLDVNICRTPDGSLNTTGHRKATHTGKYLDFASHHPPSHKRSVIHTLTKREATRPSFDCDRGKDGGLVHWALELIGYPESFINVLSLSLSPYAAGSDSFNWKARAAIMYVQSLSE